jgi:GNAT superfamily N-acetyltransferase
VNELPIRPATVADADAIAALHAASWRSAYRGIFKAVWAQGDPGFGAYIDNLHVRPERRSGGLGRRLLGKAMRRVAGRGETGAYLWVFDDNVRAIDFYRRLGGEIVEGGFDEIDGAQVAHSRIVWRDIARLANACGATP